MPASAVDRATQDFLEQVTNRLTEAGLSFEKARVLGTPRRIILAIDSIPSQQADRTEEMRGPRSQAAFDDSGAPTKALEGFCKGQGIEPTHITIRDDYVWVTKSIPGKPTIDLLSDILPDSLKALKFDKTMRWGLQKARFIRPIRWILASLDNQLISFNLFDVPSGLTSRGHRFMAPKEFTPSSWENHLSLLREHFVEPDPAERRNRIVSEAKSISSGTPDLPESLVNENVHLNEWPIAHEGTFAEEFLTLPDPVLVTAMAKHERFFPVRDQNGKILNKFISIRNNGTEANVKAGNEWVLNARFNDARFFYNEDQKRKLADFLDDTEQMLFQDQLGTVRLRADRLANLTAEVNKALGGTNDEDARNAGLYAKADLSTGLVSELSSLQGIVGGEYALREGFSPAVSQAIGAQYALPEELTEQNRLGVALLIADQVDKLAGFLGIGLIPKGSSDPFGIRRAAGLAIQATWLGAHNLNFNALIENASREYEKQGVILDITNAETALAELFQGRYESLLPEVAHDVHDAAALMGTWNDLSLPNEYLSRTNQLTEFKKFPEHIQTYTRPLNILAAARAKAPIDQVQFDSSQLTPEGKALYNAVLNHQDLKEPIHNFFETTMINDEDPKIKARNLSLLQMVETQLLKIGDFTKLVIEG